MKDYPSTYREVTTFCKMCKKPITLGIDPDCSVEWEKKLVPMATCNRCYDFRTNRNKWTEMIEKISTELKIDKIETPSHKMDATKHEETLDLLSKACHQYMATIAAFNNRTWAGDVSLLVREIDREPWRWFEMLRWFRTSNKNQMV